MTYILLHYITLTKLHNTMKMCGIVGTGRFYIRTRDRNARFKRNIITGDI